MATGSFGRKLGLLATTSIMALAVAATPVSFDVDLGGPVLQKAYAKSCFVAGTRVLMADGTVRYLNDMVPADFVEAMTTISGNEPVSVQFIEQLEGGF